MHLSRTYFTSWIKLPGIRFYINCIVYHVGNGTPAVVEAILPPKM
jgi:hypothetical protein